MMVGLLELVALFAQMWLGYLVLWFLWSMTFRQWGIARANRRYKARRKDHLTPEQRQKLRDYGPFD